MAAVLTNIGRTSWLSFSAARNGVGALGEWHDPAGYTVLTICLVLLAVLAEGMRKRFSVQPPIAPAVSGTNSISVHGGLWLAGWLVFVVLGTEIWYCRPSEGPPKIWTLAPPTDATNEPMPEVTLSLLGCDRTRAAHWTDRSGLHWELFFLEWFPHRSRTALLAQVHRPEVCLPSAGFSEAGPRRILSVSAAGFDLTMESLQFRSPASLDSYVFYCPWEFVPGRGGRNADFSDATRTSSLRRVWQRERVPGQQVVDIVITGARSRDTAESAVRDHLPGLTQPSTQPPVPK